MSVQKNALPLPTGRQVGLLLNQLLGRTVRVEQNATAMAVRQPCVIGIYVTDDDVVAALCVFDLKLGCHLGACLSMIPPVIAEESVRRGALGENIAENLYEVANVMSRMFNHDGEAHVRLREVVQALNAVPPFVGEMLARKPMRLDLNINISGYGAGPMVLLIEP